MLKERLQDFHECAWKAASRVGNSAPRVADEIISDLFPVTARAAVDEGADKMLRNGVIIALRRVLKAPPADSRQMDLADVDPQFYSLASELKSSAYYVEAFEEYVSISALVSDPGMLDDARRHMRRKGLECIAEADRLDELYEAVIASRASRH